jgi:hypothetical protein
VTGSLSTTLDELAATLDGVRSEAAGSTTTWFRGRIAFAVLVGQAVDLRLDRAIAAAALKTPDTATTARGNDWVRYAPPTLEGHDLDRLDAWFGLAYRRAAAS